MSLLIRSAALLMIRCCNVCDWESPSHHYVSVIESANTVLIVICVLMIVVGRQHLVVKFIWLQPVTIVKLTDATLCQAHGP